VLTENYTEYDSGRAISDLQARDLNEIEFRESGVQEHINRDLTWILEDMDKLREIVLTEISTNPGRTYFVLLARVKEVVYQRPMRDWPANIHPSFNVLLFALMNRGLIVAHESPKKEIAFMKYYKTFRCAEYSYSIGKRYELHIRTKIEYGI
jgi:hypothetical protein